MPASGDSPPPSAAWIELPDKRTFILTGDCHIGRIEGNEIVNPDNRISRRNSVVQRQGNGYVLVDLGSTNGTFLNDNRIFKPTRLKDGDVILIGAERYTFCQPVDPAGADSGPNDSAVSRTVVVVGKIFCWMLLVVPPEASDARATAWAEQVREALTLGGAGVKRLRGSAIFAHWRDRRMPPEKMRAIVLDLAHQPRPSGARLILHYGAVRVGPAATPAEENLLGAEVTFTHKLEAAATDLGVSVLLSDAAVQSLGLVPQVSPLGAKAVRDIPGTYPLFTIQ
jgi:predicted component of type VI protein secretion system